MRMPLQKPARPQIRTRMRDPVWDSLYHGHAVFRVCMQGNANDLTRLFTGTS